MNCLIRRRWALPAVIAAVCVCLAAAVWLLVSRTAPSDPSEAAEQPVLTCGDVTLNNTQLGYYFWSEYFYYINSGAAEQPDSQLPLDEQAYDETDSWYDFFLQKALTTARETLSLVLRAEEQGHEISETYAQQLDAVEESFRDYALANGYETESGEADLEAYLKASYGTGATVESFLAYIEDAYLAASYSDELYYGYSPDETEIEAYFTQNESYYAAQYGLAWDDAKPVSVRNILILPEADSEDDWQAAKAEAEALCSLWQAQGGTEEGFSELAQEYSDDEESRDEGGLRENLIAANIDDDTISAWCLDPARSPGDWELLETEQGYELVFFSARAAHNLAYELALEDMRYENYRGLYAEITEAYDFTVNESAIVLAVPEGLHGNTEERSVQEE